MKIMFLDESGDHGMDRIDPNYPVFVLGGVIVERTYLRTVIEPRLRQLKTQFFGRDDVILHTLDIVRAKNDFVALNDPTLRRAFYAAINLIMRELDYTVVACVIRKDAHLASHGVHAADPYYLSLELLVHRFCFEIGDLVDGGIIYAEKRRPDLDYALELAWERLRTHGTDLNLIDPEKVDDRVIGLILKDKRLNLAGLQLADLVVSPIGRKIIGRTPREDWTIVESKFCRQGDRYKGIGLVVLPEWGQE